MGGRVRARWRRRADAVHGDGDPRAPADPGASRRAGWVHRNGHGRRATGGMAVSHRARTTLIASTTAFTLVIIGTTVVNVALPAIREDLGSGVSGLQWVINAYTLMFA